MIYSEEINYINNSEFKLGKYIYMGMGECNNIKVCMSVAYKIDYCIKKAKEFESASKGTVIFKQINKVLVGELKKCDKMLVDEN